MGNARIGSDQFREHAMLEGVARENGHAEANIGIDRYAVQECIRCCDHLAPSGALSRGLNENFEVSTRLSRCGIRVAFWKYHVSIPDVVRFVAVGSLQVPNHSTRCNTMTATA